MIDWVFQHMFVLEDIIQLMYFKRGYMSQENEYHPTLTLRTIFNLSVIATFLLIGFSVFYYFVIFLPGKESTRLEQEEAKQSDRQVMINACLKKAYESYKAKWNSICKLDGLKEDCTLNTDRSEIINDYHKDLKDECYKRYP